MSRLATSTTLIALALMVALAAPRAATAAPSQGAYARAAQFVAKICPSYDHDAMNALAAVFQRTMNQRVINGRVQIMPIQLYAASAELGTLAEYCRQPGKKKVRFVEPGNDGQTPDIQVAWEGLPVLNVEVTSVTGRYPRQWAYRASTRVDALTGKVRRLHIGAAPVTEANIARAIHRKVSGLQLRGGGVIELHVAARGTDAWAAIADAVRSELAYLTAAQHITALAITSASARVVLTRDAAGQFAAVFDPNAHRPYQYAMFQMSRRVPTRDRGGARGTPFAARGLVAGPGAAVNEISRGPGATGGIDFTSLELRYVADREGRGLRYSFRAPAGVGDSAAGLKTSQDASDAFFVWLALSPSKFWVNLNPTEPNRIIDPVLGQTDAGRVLLEADLVLKKVVAPLVRPDTPGGAQFWRELEALYGPRPDQACFTARQWIVPAPAIVYEEGDEFYILQSPLDVKMESEVVGGFPGGGCPPGNEAFERLKEGIYRRLILPSVVQAVNSAPEFASLRRVYTGLIAANWFRSRHPRDRSSIGLIADSGDVSRWPAVPAWNPLDVFNRYLDSVRNGEWALDRPVAINGQEYLVNVVFGGVDFGRTPKVRVSRRDFRSRWPNLATRVDQSMRRAVKDAQGAVWFGGGSS